MFSSFNCIIIYYDAITEIQLLLYNNLFFGKIFPRIRSILKVKTMLRYYYKYRISHYSLCSTINDKLATPTFYLMKIPIKIT